MAQRFNDGTSGDVVIRSGPPASGGGSGGGFGGGGGNRVGASGNFGGPSARTIALRRKANRERDAKAAKDRADAAAHAQEQVRIQTRQQLLSGLAQRHSVFRTEVDQRFAVRAEQTMTSLEREISAMREPGVGVPITERWQLHAIDKQKSLIDGLIARKTAELNEKMGLLVSSMGTIRSRAR
jgi:hypothetical protein